MQSSRREKYFQQEEVCIRGKNVAELDDYMVQILKHGIPKDTFNAIYKDVNRFGVRCTTDLDDLNERANYPENYPKLVPFNGWGRRVDEIRVCHEWTQLHRVAAEEGLISIGYQKDLGIYNRLHQYLKCYYFSPVSGFITCPLAMTDGAARLVEQLRIERAKVEATGKPYSYPPLLDTIYEHVTSRDPDQFWTSGQWMTEKAGGSDVRQTETFATQIEGNVYSLTGYKYFTSATTANVTFTLAYIEGQKELSMFVLRIRDDNGQLNHMMIHRLKDKLGTKTVPTAEIELLGTRAELVGEAGKGVRTIANLFNITRIWTVMGSAGLMTRLLAYVRDYARRRIAFKKSLTELPAHILTVSRLEIYSRAVTQLFVKITILLGEDERSDDTKASHLLRLLTPICKLFCCKLVTEFIQEALESFGSPGYMEDTGLPAYMRDAQVNTIWEGTSNILSLDLLRAIAKEKSLPYFVTDVKNRVAKNAIKSLDSWCQQIKTYLDSIPTYLSVEPSRLEFYARDLAVSMARIYAASLLIQHANSTVLEEDAYTVNYWCSERPLFVLPLSPANRKQDDVVRALAKL